MKLMVNVLFNAGNKSLTQEGIVKTLYDPACGEMFSIGEQHLTEFNPNAKLEVFVQEIKPHLPKAWINGNKTKTGYEVNFTKYFYE
jgi:hypothetical protein